MKTLIASSCVAAFALLLVPGCDDSDPSTEQESFALLECGNPNHVSAHHIGHHHKRHHHHFGNGHMGDGGSTGAGGSMGMGGSPGTGGGSGPDCTPPDGIISWWHADGDYDDAVGTNDGTTAGAVAFGPGEQLSAFSLSGAVNSFVEVPDAASLEVTGPFTIDAWINFSGADGRIVDKVTAFSTDGYLLDTLGGTLRLYVGGDAVLTTNPLPVGAFTHVAGVYDGTSMTLYVNGSMAATKITGVAATPTNPRSLRIGADSLGNSLFNGMIDEPRLFGRALSASEISSAFQQGAVCP